jgi:hypothetical protein
MTTRIEELAREYFALPGINENNGEPCDQESYDALIRLRDAVLSEPEADGPTIAELVADNTLMTAEAAANAAESRALRAQLATLESGRDQLGYVCAEYETKFKTQREMLDALEPLCRAAVELAETDNSHAWIDRRDNCLRRMHEWARSEHGQAFAREMQR